MRILDCWNVGAIGLLNFGGDWFAIGQLGLLDYWSIALLEGLGCSTVGAIGKLKLSAIGSIRLLRLLDTDSFFWKTKP